MGRKKVGLGGFEEGFDFFEPVFVEVVGGVVFCGVFDDIVLFYELFEGIFEFAVEVSWAAF